MRGEERASGKRGDLRGRRARKNRMFGRKEKKGPHNSRPGKLRGRIILHRKKKEKLAKAGTKGFDGN